MHTKLLPRLLLTGIILFTWCLINAQETEIISDPVPVEQDTLALLPDSMQTSPDTLTLRSIRDTTISSSKDAIDSPVSYKAVDSIIYALSEKKVYLFGKSEINYQQIKLTAEIIEFDMGNEIVFARGEKDSLGVPFGRPVFADESETFQADELSYNFRTKKGIIKNIYSEQEGGYLHSETTKRHPNGHIHMSKGKYTTCDLEHPHFYIAMTKAKSIPGDKIISGPAYFVIADVPLPIGVPFGFFPTTRTNKSGILIPSYGEESRRGFYLRNGGYYLALSEYADLRINADIYTNGTWGLRVGSSYRKRYKFNGNFNTNYFENVSGEKGIDFSKSKDFAVIWSHSQDAKANPNRRFSASVNFSTGSYDQNHTRNINSVMRSTKQSSISYSKVWPNSPFNFSANASASQNSIDRSMNLRLPQMSLNMNRIYPLRRKSRVGKSKWYEDLQVSYSSSLENRLNTVDSLLFDTRLEQFDNGYQHNIPVSLNLKALNFFNISPSVRYTGVVFTKSIYPQYHSDYQLPNSDVRVDTFFIDTVQGLRYAHAYVPSIGVNFSPKIYGMYQFRPQSRIEAVRHVMTPRVSFSYTPDMKGKVPDYYQDVVIDSAGHTRTYSLFDESVYRTPVPSGRQGSVSFALMNNIEMKVKPKSDTVEKFTKVKILDNLNFTTNYNIFKDSLKWAPINMVGNTRIFKNKVNLKFNGRFDPYSYVVDARGNRRNINKSLWKDRNQLIRMTNFDFSVGVNFKSGQGSSSSRQQSEGLDNDPTAQVGDENIAYDDIYYGQYVDFDVPWTFGMDYNFRLVKNKEEPEIIQSVRFRGDLSLTPKWKIGFNSGYDFTKKKVSMTNLSIYRDLHCWEMQITMVPFGNYRSYSFQINIKSSILRDLKYEQGDNWYDNF
ncbi:MAG: LPS-assembly protein LptD [Bacteroidales bacterium]|nr:LPS-assembly protein LptD [Bacteroidales bacterium]